MRARSLIPALVAMPLMAAAIHTAIPESAGLSTERLRRVHEAVQRHIDAHDIAGAVTVIERRGRLVHFEAHGLADIESHRTMSRDNLFWIASMTKPVTAVAVLMLMEEGKIRLNDPVSRFIPEFRGMKVAVVQEQTAVSGTPPASPPPFDLVPANREITIQDLLTHVSGLLSGGPIGAAEDAKFDFKEGVTLPGYIPRLGSYPLDFQPGSRWAYSGAGGFETLGRIVEIVSSQPFDQFLRQRIFDPLGMKNTAFHASPDQFPRFPAIYHRDGNTLKKIDTPSWVNLKSYPSGSGGLMSDAEDYLRFCEMLLNGGQGNGHRLLSPRTVNLMSSVFVPDTLPGRTKGRGFGLSVSVVTDAVAANTRVSNGSCGWDGAFGTRFWIDPKEKLIGILLVHVDTLTRQLNGDFENAVMQAIIE
jgi:CubicO group peptidase (beta-lactamase class C family)